MPSPILRNPRILILDDALSSVDTLTEERILQGLAGVMRGRTVILISHRVSTVRQADNIVVLDHGRIVVERLWRSLKYEEVYLKDYASVAEARAGIERYFRFYNQERVHQSLEYQTPAAIWLARS